MYNYRNPHQDQRFFFGAPFVGGLLGGLLGGAIGGAFIGGARPYPVYPPYQPFYQPYPVYPPYGGYGYPY